MTTKYKILILGASYGSLLGAKLLLAGHTVKLICLPAEADLINAEGIRVRMPVKGREGLVELDSRTMPGTISAGGPQSANPADYDLVALAMQEPQYRSPGVRELLAAVAKAKVPCMSIMNMPPLTYLKRVPGIDVDALPGGLYRSDGVGRFRSGLHDAVQPRPAGLPSAGRKGERAAGAPADQLQVGPLRVRQAHRHPAPARSRHRGDPLRPRQARTAGEAEGARLGVRAAGQVGDADGGQLPLRHQGRHAPDQGRRAQRHQRHARHVHSGW